MTDEIRAPLFIFGFPRSGTTLLRSILASHPEIHLVNEPDLIPSLLMAGFDIDDRLNQSDRLRFLAAYEKCGGGSGKRHLSSLPPGRTERFVQQTPDPSFREGFEFLLPKPENAKVWGEKTLSLVFYLNTVYALYPSAFCVSLIRDPRAALLSLYRKRHLRSSEGRPPFTRQAMAFFAYESLLWCEWVKAAIRARQRWGERFIWQLKFEEFVAHPKEKIERICAAIGLELIPR